MSSFSSLGIGTEYRPFIIAEIAQAHEGSLGIAHSYIDAVADIGVDAIKFQTHFADLESSLNDSFRPGVTSYDQTRYDYWKRMEFSADQWQGLYNHCLDRQIHFLSSPFSVPAAQLLYNLGIPLWKIGSGEVFNPLLLDFISNTNLPIILSTGLSTFDDIDKILPTFSAHSNEVMLMQCTTQYPSPLESVGINILAEYTSRYQCLTGLSDHSSSIYPSLLAFASGASAIEVHVTFSKSMYGPDSSSSLSLSELKQVVDARNAFFVMTSNPVNKDLVSDHCLLNKSLFSKSLALISSHTAGHIITSSDLTLKKPGTGIPPDSLDSVIGSRLLRDVSSSELLSYDDLELP